MRSEIFKKLWNRTLSQIAREQDYMASQGKLYNSISMGEDAIHLRFLGHNQKMDYYVEQKLKLMKQFHVLF